MLGNPCLFWDVDKTAPIQEHHLGCSPGSRGAGTHSLGLVGRLGWLQMDFHDMRQALQWEAGLKFAPVSKVIACKSFARIREGGKCSSHCWR